MKRKTSQGSRSVRVVVHEVRLLRGRRVTGIGRDAGVEAAAPIRRELRDRDGGEDADDGHHDAASSEEPLSDASLPSSLQVFAGE